jgi:hypothetical protein
MKLPRRNFLRLAAGAAALPAAWRIASALRQIALKAAANRLVQVLATLSNGVQSASLIMTEIPRGSVIQLANVTAHCTSTGTIETLG